MTDETKTLGTLNKQFDSVPLSAEFVGTIKLQEGRGQCRLVTGLKEGEVLTVEGVLISYVLSVGGCCRMRKGRRATPMPECHREVREGKATDTCGVPCLR